MSEEILKAGDAVAIKRELERKMAEAKILELEAKISQEIAIANRIENAVDVETEEYYEASGDGKISGSLSEESAGIDISGGGKKIVKCTYIFKGNVKS